MSCQRMTGAACVIISNTIASQLHQKSEKFFLFFDLSG
ncbi:hypothetical protein SynBIOSE41_02768 [Synechococcus sp. BIOS-E4-1]|nr:hypothetical protein SynBIOSE41_02768 [Synechococcus sp. BIOS-E4-1]